MTPEEWKEYYTNNVCGCGSKATSEDKRAFAALGHKEQCPDSPDRKDYLKRVGSRLI